MSYEAQAKPGRVYLVGAGPGSLDLLTLRAHSLIVSASCLLHDDLVSAEVLSAASPHALVPMWVSAAERRRSRRKRSTRG